MEKIKVLHCYKTYYPVTLGGIEQVIFQLAESTVENGVESIVFSVNNLARDELTRFHNHYVSKVKKDFEIASTPFSFKALGQFKKLAEKVDIIHYHFPYPFMDLLHFLSRTKKPTIVSYHSDIIKQKKLMIFYKPLMNLFLNNVDRIVAASPNYISSSETLKKFMNKVLVIPYGITDITKLPKDKQTLEIIKNKFPNGYFLFVGNFRYYKGLSFLLEAVKGIDIPIVLLGASGEEQKLRDFVIKNQMTNIHFVGAKGDDIKFAYLSQAVGFVFPSHLRSEAFGISLVEAACFGLPLISCEIGTGTTYINIHNKTGIVIEAGNSREIKDAIADIWLNREKYKQYGRNARARYDTLFTSQSMADKYLSLYEEVLSEHANR
ncbi:glycosyltransferase [Dickeya chrysanthemi]|uniref:glycosyltransferase n=1 Tax=Dickeya chrysanthemi TaxID=556 RepID=UPI0003A5B494|nr:glycosyltransferase [Dickeya chrysanthemi]